MSNIIQAFPKGSGGGGGHTILDSSGTATAQESNLQFTGLSVTDDSVNEKTEVAGEGLNAESINDIAEANSTVPAVIIGDANNYSTSEKIVGKWIDGKPIYQKTFTGTTSATTSSDSVAGTIANFDTLVNSNGTIFLAGTWGVNQHSLPYDNVIEYYIDTSNQVIIHKQNEIANTKQYMVTIQYTKTTDA